MNGGERESLKGRQRKGDRERERESERERERESTYTGAEVVRPKHNAIMMETGARGKPTNLRTHVLRHTQ